MLFVGALLCVVVCQVSLVRAFMRVCVPYLTTRLEEELSLQQVRNLLVPLELKALSLVLASTPTVSAGSVLGSERDSCSVSSALVYACVRIVHYIWRINGAPQGTRRKQLEALQGNRELHGSWGKCRFLIRCTSTYRDVYDGILLLGRKVRVWYVEMYASRLNILLATGTELSRAEFFCTAQPPLDFPRKIGNCAGISCLTHRVFYCNLRWFRFRFQDDACPLIPPFDRGESVVGADTLRGTITGTCLVIVNVGTGLAKIPPKLWKRSRLDRLGKSEPRLGCVRVFADHVTLGVDLVIRKLKLALGV